MTERPRRPMRALVLSTAFLLLAGAVVYRLGEIQVRGHEAFTVRAASQQSRRVTVQAERGDILDRNGQPLAQSSGRLSLYVHPMYLKEPHANVDLDQLARHAAFYDAADFRTVRKRLDAKSPVALVRAVQAEDAERLAEVLDTYGIDSRGYWLHRESKRTYPRAIAGPVIGFCSTDADGDNVGMAGIEQVWGKTLSGKKTTVDVARSAASQAMAPVPANAIRDARGNTIVLTIDSVIQEVAEKALAEAVEEFAARGGAAIVVEIKTGDILAMATYPTFDNNDFKSVPTEALNNLTISAPLETGSVVKLFTSAFLIDLGLLTPDTLVDCEGGRAVIDGRRITDAPGHDPLHVVPFRVALRYSSNVGIVKLALQMDNETWHRYLRSFGFGQKSGLGLAGESAGILHPLSKWTKFSRTSLPMGYEIALTPIQIVNAVAALVNDGKYMKPRLVKEIRDNTGRVVQAFEPEVLRQVVKPTTSAIMRDLMGDVVDEGTGKKAQVPGYTVGGKTGTTVKSQVKTHKEYFSSFAGVVPLENPVLSIYVYVDAPTKARYGGTIAAPAFAKIARAGLLQLGVPPTVPVVADADDTPEGPGPAAVFPVSEGTSIVDALAELPLGATMPDLRGLSIAEIRERLPKDVASVAIAGSGVCTDQMPPPGEPLTARTEVYLHLATDGLRPAAIRAAEAASASRKSAPGGAAKSGAQGRPRNQESAP